MTEIVKKRRGCPPGGWPSQKAKKALKKAPSDVRAIVKDVRTAKEPAPESFLTVNPYDPLLYAFDIVHEGSALWAVVMYTVQGGQVIAADKISSGDFAKNAVRRMANAVMQLHLNQRKPDLIKRSGSDIMPTVGGQL